MEELIQKQKQQLIEEYLPAPEPVTTIAEVNPYTTDLIVIVVGIAVLGSVYKLWLLYGKK